MRHGKAAERWFPVYYGSVDATPLWLVLLSEVIRWTEDLGLARELHEPALRALAWIDEWGDRDGDGFVEYERRTPRGLLNQSWKDSGDSQRFADGRIAEGPIAPCEVQGYVYDAKRRMAELARLAWRDRPLAERLDAEADALMERFNEAFWVDARGGYYALALDGEKRPVDSLSSNVGHLLWSGIVPEERVECIVDALAGDALFSGWGVRTMSADDAGYNPLSYHNGTVWPHDNSLIAAGLARCGPLVRGVPDRAADARGVGVLRLPAAGGLRRAAALRDAVPDRVPDGGAAAGVGRGDARAAAPADARAAAERRAACARERGAGAAVVGRGRAARGRPRLRPPLGRGYTGGARGDRSGVRVAIVSPVWFPVPPTGYGGIEWVVSLLADGLVDAGHDVALFASGDSRTKAELRAVYERAPSEWIGNTFWELRHFMYALDSADEFDILHDHTGLLGLTLTGLSRTPAVHTVHGPMNGEPGELYATVCRLNPAAKLISLSLNQRKPRPDLPWLANCPNALDFSLYPGTAHRGDYLCFLGRMSVEKGCHRAIAVARAAGLPLKIAGKNREPLERQYFDEFVAPHLDDQIEYLGEVNHGEKVELLGNARATLFPIQWEEPFGLVMIESMACGTPVIATRWGAVEEVIEDGVNGAIVDHYRDMPAALERTDALDPAAIRSSVEERFAPERMVRDYLAAYEAAVSVAESV